VIYGVDPGLKGSIAYRDGDRMRVAPLTDEWRPQAGDVVWIEETLAVPFRSVQSTSTTERNYGDLLRRIRDAGAELRSVHPRTWQSKIGISKAKGEKTRSHKSRIAAAMRRVYPSIGEVADADSVGILHYGLRVLEAKRCE
jgi:hypothetical protein